MEGRSWSLLILNKKCYSGLNVSDKEEDNEDIRDEIDDIVEAFNKNSDDEWSESSDTESDKKSSAWTLATQNPTVNSQNNFRWREKQPCSFDMSFKGEHFPPPPLVPLSPYQYFKIFFDDNLIKQITEQTNLYPVQTSGKLINVTTDEMEQYFSILVRMSIIKLPQVRMYWTQSTQVLSISNIMSINRFEKIRQYLHCNDNSKNVQSSDPNYDKLYKVRPVVDSVLKNTVKYPQKKCTA